MFRALVIIATTGLLAGCNTFTPREIAKPSKVEFKGDAGGRSVLHDRDKLLARGGGGNTKDDGGYGNGGTGDGGGKLHAPE